MYLSDFTPEMYPVVDRMVRLFRQEGVRDIAGGAGVELLRGKEAYLQWQASNPFHTTMFSFKNNCSVEVEVFTQGIFRNDPTTTLVHPASCFGDPPYIEHRARVTLLGVVSYRKEIGGCASVEFSLLPSYRTGKTYGEFFGRIAQWFIENTDMRLFSIRIPSADVPAAASIVAYGGVKVQEEKLYNTALYNIPITRYR